MEGWFEIFRDAAHYFAPDAGASHLVSKAVAPCFAIPQVARLVHEVDLSQHDGKGEVERHHGHCDGTGDIAAPSGEEGGVDVKGDCFVLCFF